MIKEDLGVLFGQTIMKTKVKPKLNTSNGIWMPLIERNVPSPVEPFHLVACHKTP
jgi:hypothetical protein